MIVVDIEKCNGCGLCVKDCVRRAITVIDKVAKQTGSCIECGHCIAVCPRNAVELIGYDMDEVVDLSSILVKIDAETLLSAIKSRRSIRQFEKRPVEDEKILKIIEAGRYTPTARNMQNVEYIIVRDDIKIFELEARKTLAKITERLNVINDTVNNNKPGINFDAEDESFFFRGATALILVVSEHEVNAALASANMELMAEAQGLGVLYVGYFTAVYTESKELQGLLNLGEGKKIVTCMALGYPAVKYKRTVPRLKPKIEWR